MATVNPGIRVLAIVGVFFAAAMLCAQDAPFVMKLDSNSILVDVTVTDSAKKPVTNLPRDAFRIYEDGKLQELTGFYSVETPYSVLLLFDRSTSTENQWPLLQTALERFFDALRPQDSVSIATFTGSTTLRLDWWNLSKGRPADVLSAVKIGKVTDFYGAINWSANRLKKLNTRKGVVVLTDGLDSTGIMRLYPPEVDDDFQKLLRNVRSGGIPYYFVALNTDLNSDSGSATGRARMEQLAEASGGVLRVVRHVSGSGVIENRSKRRMAIANANDRESSLRMTQARASGSGVPWVGWASRLPVRASRLNHPNAGPTRLPRMLRTLTFAGCCAGRAARQAGRPPYPRHDLRLVGHRRDLRDQFWIGS